MKKDTTIALILGAAGLGLAVYAVARQRDKRGGGSDMTPSLPGMDDAGGDVMPYAPSIDTSLLADTWTPFVGGSESWYAKRDIAGILGWSQQEYHDVMQAFPQRLMTARGAITAEEWYAAGHVSTVEAGERMVQHGEMVSLMGGTWEGGVLTPPPGYQGTATAFLGAVNKALTGVTQTYTIVPGGSTTISPTVSPETGTAHILEQGGGIPFAEYGALPGMTTRGAVSYAVATERERAPFEEIGSLPGM
tara:strand:+ start:4787 stop:5530 length:744 start_codon:yes stop_codon:yes gene_type:complete